jgi:hypothetical protein
MPTQLNGGLWLLLVGVPSGYRADWYQIGAPYGKVRTYEAHLLTGRPGVKRVELELVYRADVPDQGGYQSHVVVHDMGPSPSGNTIAVLYTETVNSVV